jgi:hypothetical protein
MASVSTITEADILEDVVSSKEAGLTPEVARFFLSMKFSKDATKQIRQLLRKNNRGTISAQDREALARFHRVGQLIDLLQAR